MITTIVLGILTSMVAEIVTAINKKLQGTLLQGEAAFIIALVVGLLGGAVKVFYVDGVPLPTLSDFTAWKALYPSFAEVWTVSQIYFLFVVQKLNLDVRPGAAKPTAPAPAGAGV